MMNISFPSVLFIGAFPGPAPLERYVTGDLASRLRSRGWRVDVTSRRVARMARFAGILIHCWRTRNRYSLACVDVYSGFAFAWAETATAILRRLKKPYILTLHGGDLPGFARRFPGRVKRLLCSANGVTCPSGYLLTAMRQFRADVRLIPNGLELSRYAFRQSVPPIRELIWLRAYHDVYNPCMAVQVIADVHQSNDQVRLTMIGPDKGDGSLDAARRAAKGLGIADKVTFGGAIAKEAVPLALGKADVFLNTTNYDNTPVSVLEAMACGLPVVSTDVGGIPFILEHDKTALLSKPGDAAAMSRNLLRLLKEPELLARVSGNARLKVEKWDWNRVLPDWETFLSHVGSRKA